MKLIFKICTHIYQYYVFFLYISTTTGQHFTNFTEGVSYNMVRYIRLCTYYLNRWLYVKFDTVESKISWLIMLVPYPKHVDSLINKGAEISAFLVAKFSSNFILSCISEINNSTFWASSWGISFSSKQDDLWMIC